MFRFAIIPAFAIALIGAPAFAVPLPDTLKGQILTLIPDAQVEGRDFSEEEIDALEAAVGTGDSPADKVTLVQQILDEGLDGAAAN